MLALEHAGPAIYDMVDDEPAQVREWLPVLAALGGGMRVFPDEGRVRSGRYDSSTAR